MQKIKTPTRQGAQSNPPRVLPNYCSFGSDIRYGYALSFGSVDGDVLDFISKADWDKMYNACDPLDFLTAKSWAGLGPDPLAVITHAHKVAVATRKLYIANGGTDCTDADPGLPLNVIIDGLLDLRSVLLKGKTASDWLPQDQYDDYCTPHGVKTAVPNKQGLKLFEYAQHPDYPVSVAA